MTTGPTDVKVTTTAGGPGGMPLALRLNEGLGITGRDVRGVASLAYPQVSLDLQTCAAWLKRAQRNRS